METSTLKHLKKCSRLFQDNPILKLHYKTQITKLESNTVVVLSDQNEQFKKSKKDNIRAKNGVFECQWCFQVCIAKI